MMPVMSAIFSFISLNLLLFGELFDALFFRQFANEQLAGVLGHDIAVEPLHNDLFLVQGVDDAVVGVENGDVRSYQRIVIEILSALCQQTAPCA